MKRKLLFAMLCIVSVLGMRAQTTLTGVSSITNGEYYIVNDATGLFLTPGNDYGTRATLDQSSCGPATVTLADGKYTIKWSYGNGLFVNADDGSSLYCDMNAQGNNFWTITSNGDNTFSLQLASDQARYNANSYLTAASSAVFANVQYNASNESLRKWRFISASALRASMPSSSSKMDVSIFVHGAQCMISGNNLGNFKKMYPWKTSGNDWKGQNNADPTGFSKPWLECWNGSALTSRSANNTISSLPAGSYTLSAYTIGGNGVTFYAKVGDGEKITAETGNGSPILSTINFDIESESANVEFGIESTAESTSSWIAIDNVKLEYISFSAFRAVYEAALQNAQDASDALDDFSVYASQKSSLDDVISSNTLTGGDLNSRSALTAATTALENATTAVAVQVAACNQYATIVTTIGENTNVNLTSFVSNAGFEDGNLTGWTSSNGGATANNGNFSQKVGTYFVERWQANGDNQVQLSDGTLTHDAIVLPAGIYQISATGQVQEQKNGTTGGGYYLCGNSERVEIGAPARYNTYVKLDDDKSELVIKFQLDGCTGNWISCDDVQLTYVGSDFPAYTLVTGKMSAAASTAQSNAENTYQASKTVSNYNALVAAITAAQVSKDAYAKTAEALTNVNALKDAHNFATAAATTTFTEAIGAVQTAYDDATLTDENAAKGGNLGTILVGWHTPRAEANWTVAEAYMQSAWTGGELNDWSTEGDSDGSNFHVPFFQNWVEDGNSLSEGTTSGQLTGLENGLYKVSALIRVRAKNGTAATDATGITMAVNGGTPVDVTEGTQVGETQFSLGTFEAQGLVKDGTLNAIFTRANGNNVSWLSFKNVKYTKVRDLTPAEEAPATADDYAALNTAIANAEAKTLGFDEDDYAPYNNIPVLTALAAAKAINQEGDNAHDDVVAATNAIADSEWNANVEEVNAVYDGTFAAATNNGAPKGWTMSNNTLGGDYHSRAFVGDSRLSEFNGTNSGLFLRFDGTNSNRGSMYYYGNTENYTMPLKKDVTYYAKVDFTNWGTTSSKPLRMNVTGPEGFSGTGLTVNSTKNADTGSDTPDQILFVFTANVAGNYTINFQCPGSDDNKHNVLISNVELFRATPATMKITDAKYATFVAPFDVEIPAEVTAYTIDGAEGNTLTMTKVSTTIKANTPVVLFKESTLDATTFYGMPVAGEPTEGLLTGVYTETVATAGTYVLQNNDDLVGFYQVEAGEEPTVGANRAYLTAPTAGVKAFFFDDVTAIKNVFDGVAAGNIYDLNGRKVSKMQKGGVYVVNGKKILVK